jgi:transcriptional regulator with XRE-family HTH domain
MYKFSTGEILEAARLNLGVNQQKLAKALSVSQSYISKLEKNASRDASFGVISKFCSEFDVPIRSFHFGFLELEPILIKKTMLNGYTKNGEIRARLAHSLIEEVSNLTGEDIYSFLNLRKCSLAFCKLMFSPAIFLLLRQQFPCEYRRALRSCTKNLNLDKGLFIRNLKQAPHLSLKGLDKNTFEIKYLGNSSLSVKDTKDFVDLIILDNCLQYNAKAVYEISRQEKNLLLKVS